MDSIEIEEIAAYPGCTIYFDDFGAAVDLLSDAEYGKLQKAVFQYARYEIVSDLDDKTLNILFKQAMPRVDADRLKWISKCLKNKHKSLKQHNPGLQLPPEDIWVEQQIQARREQGLLGVPQNAMASRGLPMSANLTQCNLTTTQSNIIKVDEIEDAFLKWWEEYPVKKGKQAARKAFTAAYKKAGLPKLLEALRQQKENYSRKKNAGQFAAEFPNPAKWLKEERWEDEIPAQTLQGNAVSYRTPNITADDLVQDPRDPSGNNWITRDEAAALAGGEVNG